MPAAGVAFATMRTSAAALAVLLSACASTPPPPAPAPMSHATSLAAAETAFAAHSVREDMRVAFMAAFAPDGVLVRDGWTVSNEWFRNRAAPPIVLDWRPQYVEAAASGDLGLSTGPWKITSKAKPDTPPSFGQFVSIWRRDAAGAWKVAVDLGIAHPADTLWSAPLESRQLVAPAGTTGGGVAEAEARFVSDARARGLRAAYTTHAADNMRFYRTGLAPAIGRPAALASAAMTNEEWTWTTERTETARSGEFAYARGAYAASSAPAVALGWYLRVWRREAAGWRIVMDVINPAPAKK
jgi:ketosteroid isomerase-like protein